LIETGKEPAAVAIAGTRAIKAVNNLNVGRWACFMTVFGQAFVKCLESVSGGTVDLLKDEPAPGSITR
jgi:hypothetical protein